MTISNSTISNNSTGGNGQGGGIHSLGSLNITNTTISNNTAGNNGQGGGIYSASSLITNSVITNNSAGVAGGIYNGSNFIMTINNSTISNNSATNGAGGGIYSGSSGQNLVVTNSTISGNTTVGGGGGIISQGTVTVTNLTISNNSAGAVGGGGIWNNTVGTVNSKNTIIAGNTSPNGPDFYGNLTSQGYNLIGNPSGMGLIGGPNDILNPVGGAMLGPLAYNGGPTQTHKLLSGSPAIDKGSFVAGLTTDQRGITRPFENLSIPNATGGDGSDIGAYETECPTLTPVITGELNFCDGTSTTLDAGVYAGYSWSTAETSQTISVSTAGTFTVTVTDANGCTGSNSVITIINPNPTPSISGDLSFCEGSSTTLDAGVYSGYNWSTGETSQTISVNTAETFTVTVTDANGCTGSASVTTTLKTKPIANISGSLSFCDGKSTQLCGNAGASSYFWSNNETSQCITVTDANSYSVTVTNGFGCTGSTSVTTIVKPNPTPSISGTLSFCNGSSTTLNAGLFAGYLWSTLATTQTISVSTAETFTVTVTDDNGCTGSTSVTTTVKSYSIGAISGPAGVCSKQSGIVYCVTNPSPGITSYIWTLPSGASVIGASNGPCITLKFSSKFKGGSICAKAETPCGYTPNSYMNVVLINRTPNTPGTITGPSTLCPNATASYSIAVVPSATSYLWSVPSNMQILSGQGSISVVVKALSNFNSGYVKVRAMNCKDGSGTKSMHLIKSRGCRITATTTSGSVITSENISGFNVYPNPTSGQLSVTFIAESKSKLKLNVMDLLGKNILMNGVQPVVGINTKEIDLSHLAKGMYFISIEMEGVETQTLRIVVD